MSSPSPARGDGGDEEKARAGSATTATFSKSKTKRNVVYVYVGKGAGARSALSAARALERSLPLASVRTLSTQALLEGSWAKESAVTEEEEEEEEETAAAASAAASAAAAAAALVMPGGADLPYLADLAGEGNRIIREFVRDAGGTYLGLCAGAYYGCSRVEFEPRSEALRVVGDRELSFFPGAALGAVVPGFEYETERGAAATRLRWRRRRRRRRARFGRREEKEEEKESGSGEGENDDGEEEEEEEEWRECRDYCNGGPVFVLRREGEESESSSDSHGRVPDECELEGVGVEVLARYDGAATPPPSSSSSSPSSSSSSPSSSPSSPSRSPAVAAAAEGGAAAVRCSVGKGVAVLCGTHPELSPAGEWLLPPSAASASEEARSSSSRKDNGNGNGIGGGSKSTAVATAQSADTRVSELVSSLDAPEAAREREAYWESLLDAARLGGLRG